MFSPATVSYVLGSISGNAVRSFNILPASGIPNASCASNLYKAKRDIVGSKCEDSLNRS